MLGLMVFLANSEFPLSKCLEMFRSSLDAWNKLEFGHVGRQIDTLQKHLAWLEVQLTSPGIISDLRNTRAELNSCLDKEDVMWLQ